MALIAQIVKVEAPSRADSGATVIIDVHVKNLGHAPGGYNYVIVTGNADGTILSWQFDFLYLAPQETVVFRGWFIMPSKNVRATVWSWYWDGSQWQVKDKGDDTAFVDISLLELVPAFSEFKITDYRIV